MDTKREFILYYVIRICSLRDFPKSLDSSRVSVFIFPTVSLRGTYTHAQHNIRHYTFVVCRCKSTRTIFVRLEPNQPCEMGLLCLALRFLLYNITVFRFAVRKEGTGKYKR